MQEKLSLVRYLHLIKKTSRLTDGVFRTSARGWYSFSHIALAFSFFFGHLWHASRAIFQDIWTGVTFESQAKQEYGRNEKLGDKTSSTKKLFEPA